MADLLSPGVRTREIDLTNTAPSEASEGAGFVGQFAWGSVDTFVDVESKTTLISNLGTPNDVNYVDWFSVSNYLDYSNSMQVVRVVDDATALNSSADGAGILIKNEDQLDTVRGTPGGNVSLWAAKYPGVLANGIEVRMADANSFTGWVHAGIFDEAPGTSDYAISRGAPNANDELHVVVVDVNGAFQETPGAVLEKFSFLSKAKDGKTTDGEPNFYSTIINRQSRYVSQLADPVAADYAQTGDITAITVDNAGAGYETAPVVTITGTGTLAAATAVLTATGGLSSVAITAPGTGYSIGDPIIITGDGTGAAAEVLTIGLGGDVLTTSITAAGTGYSTITLDLTLSGNGDATTTGTLGFGVDTITVDAAGSGYTTPVVTISAPDTGALLALASATVGNLVTTGTAWSSLTPVGTELSVLDSALVYSLTGGNNGTNVTSTQLIAGWDLFKNAEIVQVSFLFVGDAGGSANSQVVIKHVIDNIAEVRQDVVVFFSSDLQDTLNLSADVATANVVEFENTKINSTSSYAVMDSGWMNQVDIYNDTTRWIPLNSSIAGLEARKSAVADPWVSLAGTTHGRIKNVIRLSLNPSLENRNDLYPKINPVVSFSGEGVLLFGDRTLNSKSGTFNQIGIRRLFITIKKVIAEAGRATLFGANDEFTRGAFRNRVEPYLTSVQARRGVVSFQVIADESNNPVSNQEFVGQIFVVPVGSINFVKLDFISVPDGIEFSEVTGIL